MAKVLTLSNGAIVEATLAEGGNPVGTIIAFAAGTAPTGYLQCPTAATTVSRTTYAALFAVLGTTWGDGDGSTTFGIPFFPAGYAAITGTPGTANSAGQVIAHTHTVLTGTNIAGSSYINKMSSTNVSSTTTVSTGGAANLAAGVNLMMCIKY